jgi:hypothetical protein
MFFRIYYFILFIVGLSSVKMIANMPDAAIIILLIILLLAIIPVAFSYISNNRENLKKKIGSFFTNLNVIQRLIICIFIFWWIALFSYVYVMEPFGMYLGGKRFGVMSDSQKYTLFKLTFIPPISVSIISLICFKFLNRKT